MSSTLTPHAVALPGHAPVRRYFTPSFRAIASGASGLPRNLMSSFAVTPSVPGQPRAAPYSSDTPSLRYAWVVSPLRFSKAARRYSTLIRALVSASPCCASAPSRPRGLTEPRPGFGADGAGGHSYRGAGVCTSVVSSRSASAAPDAGRREGSTSSVSRTRSPRPARPPGAAAKRAAHRPSAVSQASPPAPNPRMAAYRTAFRTAPRQVHRHLPAAAPVARPGPAPGPCTRECRARGRSR